MGAPSASTVNSVNYRVAATLPTITISLTHNYSWVYGTAYNNTTANQGGTNYLTNSANTSVTAVNSSGGGFGIAVPTSAQALASLRFASNIGGNSNAVQTTTSLVGSTGIVSTYGYTVNTTAGTYTITKATLTITGTQLSSTYDGVTSYAALAAAGYTSSGLVTSIGRVASGS